MTASEPRPSAHRRAAAWALGLGVLATVGLAMLAWGLVVMHALSYGTFQVLRPDATTAPPDERRYALALAAGAGTALLVGPVLAGTTARRLARPWPPSLVGTGAAVLAAIAGASVLLLTLGVDPVSFVVSG